MTKGTRVTGKAVNAACEYARKANKRAGRRAVRRELQALADKARVNRKYLVADAYHALASVRWCMINMYTGGGCQSQAIDTVIRWDEYITRHCKEKDLSTDELGQAYREIASVYNRFADNFRDESHETTVER